MSIKPTSQRRLLQLTCFNSDFKTNESTLFDTNYSLFSDPIQIVYINRQENNLKEENEEKKVNYKRFAQQFNLDEIYQVRD